MGRSFNVLVVNASLEGVKGAIGEIQKYPDFEDDIKAGFIDPEPEKVVVFLKDYSSCAAEITREISLRLECPAFHIQVYDGDFWMYEFYVNGLTLDRFNTKPGYFAKISEKEKQEWRGNPEMLASYWPNLKVSDIDRYLVHSSEVYSKDKAYETDKHGYGDFWQMTDFMAKLGTPNDYKE